jgi:hypothetical protein
LHARIDQQSCDLVREHHTCVKTNERLPLEKDTKNEFSVVGLADYGQRRCAIVTTPSIDVAVPRTGAPW